MYRQTMAASTISVFGDKRQYKDGSPGLPAFDLLRWIPDPFVGLFEKEAVVNIYFNTDIDGIITDPKTGEQRVEDEHEMIVRLIKNKTGVVIPLSDIEACHALNKRGSDSSFIIRISNRKPGSAWSTLAARMLTGMNNVTKSNFTQDNLFLNFQLTKKRGELAKVIRKARYDKKIAKYSVDQNGNFTVKVKSNNKWQGISSTEDLELAITNSKVVHV